ncbi:MAG: 1-deoxy-D-xylulose-5-phosphate reductoisomerase [Fibrobacterota bacterium]|nr:1-deoxy-D-xylulose-5-phosphate reductoisomerase [Chitinispirillaceae bacterium]
MILQKILLLGSTGSIGTSTLHCVRRFPEKFTIAGLAANRNVALLIEQIEEFRPSMVFVGDSDGVKKIKDRFGDTVTVLTGADGLESLVRDTGYDVLLNALVGAVGLRSTVAALKQKKRVALANKESLVVGGDYITSLLDSGNGSLIPVDSEHSAILQCLAGVKDSTIESLILTASGGPFRNRQKHEFESITPADALNHPTWSMGKKITIDSATLMNKGFEIIEAHHLFRLPYSQLRVWIHPQSIIHSLVEFHDGAILAQLGLPDMELPIQYALSYPERFPMSGKRLSLPQIQKLDFYDPDLDRFPCLRLCIEAGTAGGTAPVVVNAANEIAVEAFLNKQIGFNDIPAMVSCALERHTVRKADSLETIIEVDSEIRRSILKNYLSRR